MRKIEKYDYFIKEAQELPEQSQDDNNSRSGRVLTQAQKEYEESPDLQEQTGPMPVMMFTDVEGSSKMWSDDPQKMAEQLENHHKLIQDISEKHKGWIVKTIGDAFMVYFEPSGDSLVNAVQCAKEIIQTENAYNLRIGICQGFMDEKTYRIQKVDLRDFFGNSVNTASRMESKVAGKGGTIAFCSTKPIGNYMGPLRAIGKVFEVNLKEYDLRGATIEKAYKMKVK